MVGIKFVVEKKYKKYPTCMLLFRNKAFAIPLVILLAVVLMIFAFMLINTNVQSRKQRNSTILTTKAYFMALAGIQHFKLKYKLLPEQLFDCSRMYYGYSPFYVPPGGAAFDQFSSINESKRGKRFPEYVANFIEDINSYDTDPDGSASGGKTTAGARSLVKIQNPNQEVKQNGSYETWKFTFGGFSLESAEANDKINDWGYKIVDIKCGSMRKENDPAKLNGGLPYIEQSITIEIEGKAKSNVGGINEGESEYRRHVVKETIVVKRQVMK